MEAKAVGISSGVSDMQRPGERLPKVHDASISRLAKACTMSLSICMLLSVVCVSQLLSLGNSDCRTSKQFSRWTCEVSKFACRAS